MNDENPFLRASRLPPPTSGDVLLLNLLMLLVEEKPKRLERWLEKAKDQAAATKIRRLHDMEGNSLWEQPFAHAEIRAESVAAMIRAQLPANEGKPKKRKKR